MRKFQNLRKFLKVTQVLCGEPGKSAPWNEEIRDFEKQNMNDTIGHNSDSPQSGHKHQWAKTIKFFL